MNLLEWLTKLRETFYALDCWLTIKGYDSGSLIEEMHRARYRERVPGFHALSSTPLSTSPLVHQQGSSLDPVLRELMAASLYGLG